MIPPAVLERHVERRRREPREAEQRRRRAADAEVRVLLEKCAVRAACPRLIGRARGRRVEERLDDAWKQRLYDLQGKLVTAAQAMGV